VLRVLSDNGSEFKKHFTQALKDRKVTHWKIYPGKPQLNAICERFNRTIKEDFLMLNKELLISDPQLFYSKLSDWLFWYNTERAHHGLGYNTPMHQIKKQKNSNRLWTYTISL
ncbi:MAG: transposase, partial [Candidatus Portiera sp.]|nr:transposase [Portiera sp.]